MQKNTPGFGASQGEQMGAAGSSRGMIEVLGLRLETLDTCLKGDLNDEERQLIFDEQFEILELLSFHKPETPLDIPILKRALAFHLEWMTCGSAEKDDEDARQERFAKAFRIQCAINEFSKSFQHQN